MIDKNELEWGLRPLREIETVAIYGARTIFRNGSIEFLRDRQKFLGGEEPREALCNWINEKASGTVSGRRKTWSPI
jgi:hypothetical protein